jgi:hypothetical protein
MPAENEVVPKNGDSLYWFLFIITTVAVVISLGTLAITLLLQPKGEQVSLPPAREKMTKSGQISQSSETWGFGGFALGKKAGNEDAFGVMMADVIKLDGGRYRMYYGWAGQGGTGIKSAISNDAKKWTIEEGFRLKGASDKNDRENVISGPSVVKLPDGRYRMYYQSSPQQPPNEEPKFHVRSAISSNGLTFSREGVRIEISSIDSNSPLKLAGHGTYFIANNGKYVGIFSGNFKNEMGPSELVMATSSDGLTFNYADIKKLYEDWHDPIVLKTQEGYKIYATYLLEKQGMAISSDGLNWPSELTTITFQDEKGNKLTEESSGVGDLGAVVTENSSIIIYANWGSPSQDLVYFEKQ